MDLRQLEYFRVVARLENMTAAAKELHVAQPSLSKTIALLEDDLGIQLFDRKGKRIRLNEYGQIFLRTAEKVAHTLENGRQELAELTDNENRSVTVGVSFSRFLQDLVQEYLLIYPDSRFKIRHINQQRELEEKLLRGDLDVGIFYTPMNHPEIISKPLLTEEIYLAVPADHPLAAKEHIQLNEAADESFISIATDIAFGEMTTQFCHEAGFSPSIAFEIESLEFVVNLVKKGLGITFIPASWEQSIPMDFPKLLPIDSPTCQRTIWISWVKERYQTTATREFRDFSLVYFEKLRDAEQKNK